MRSEIEVSLPRPPAGVFPWLFDDDKVPRWTSALEAYEGPGSGGLAVGSVVRQRLEVAGQRLALDMEVVRLDVPGLAELRFEAAGIAMLNRYVLAPGGEGTLLRQELEAEPQGFKARMLAPILQPRLEEKLRGDLARLRELLTSAA